MLKRLRILTICILALFISIFSADAYKAYIRERVAAKVVYLTNERGNSGGTGSYVTAPSGKTYIITNAHVCDVSKNGYIYLSDNYGSYLQPTKILEKSGITDLCLVEPLDNSISGLSLASGYDIPEDIQVIGHPKLMGTTRSVGEIIEKKIVQVGIYLIRSQEDAARCNQVKNRIIKFESFFGEMQICAIEVEALQTNAVIQPGNSGSPVVNVYGNVIGVAFAGDNDVHWGLVIPLEEVKAFLLYY